jgi:hypothetical protein
MRRSIRRASLLVVCALVASVGSAPRGRLDGAEERDGAFGHPLDLTDDLYHRLKAGLFVPECEPLVIRASSHPEEDEEPRSVAHEYYRFEWHLGRFDVRTSETGVIVLHADREALLSHLRIWSPALHHSMAREFLHYPAHPIR